MAEPNFLIKTKMEKADYRKFLYIATFRRNKFALPLIAFIALIGSVVANWASSHFNVLEVILTWIFMCALAIAAVCFKVERKNKQRISTDQTGTFESINVLQFYEDKVVMENESLHSTGELQYEQFFQLLESKDYFIFYLTIHQASLVRKKDIDHCLEFKRFLTSKFAGRYLSIDHASTRR